MSLKGQLTCSASIRDLRCRRETIARKQKGLGRIQQKVSYKEGKKVRAGLMASSWSRLA